MKENAAWEQVFTNVITTYSLNKSFQLWSGLVYYYSKDEDEIIHEIRPWEGIMIFFPRIKGFYFQHLIRMEERFYFQQHEGYIDHDLRARYSLFGFIPLNHAEVSDNTLYLWPGIDYYLAIAGKQNETYINKSRYNIGLGYRFNKIYRVEFCYMAQFSKDHIGEHFQYEDRIFRLVNHITL